MVVEDFGAGESRAMDFRELLQGSCSSNPTVWRRVMGDIPLDWEEPRQFLPQDGPTTGKDAAKEGRDGYIDLSAAGSGHEVSGAVGGGDVRNPLLEYCHPVYFHLANTGAISSVVETFGSASVEEMVLTGRPRPREGRYGDKEGDGRGGGKGGQRSGEGGRR